MDVRALAGPEVSRANRAADPWRGHASLQIRAMRPIDAIVAMAAER